MEGRICTDEDHDNSFEEEMSIEIENRFNTKTDSFLGKGPTSDSDGEYNTSNPTDNEGAGNTAAVRMVQVSAGNNTSQSDETVYDSDEEEQSPRYPGGLRQFLVR